MSPGSRSSSSASTLERGRLLWFGDRLGTNIGAEGDSGAPICIPLTSTTAQAIGMHIAGMMSAPFDQTWFHSVAGVESQLGVTIAFCIRSGTAHQ